MNEMFDNNIVSPTSTKEKCPYCGGVIEAGSRFCGYCGSKIERPTHIAENTPYQTPADSQGPKPKAPLGTASMVCSIVGMGLLLLMLLVADEDEDLEVLIGLIVNAGIAASIVGMVLGIVGLKRINGNYNAYSDSPKLTVGKVLGIVGVVIWSVVMTLGVILILAEEGIEGFL